MALEFQTDAGYGGDALGLIVLKTDQSMEPELRDIIAAAGRVLYHSRIAFATVVNAETLARMAQDIPKTTALLPEVPFRVIGYGCTSGATVIGSARVAELVQSVYPGVAVTDPMAAVIAAARALGARRLGILTPYSKAVSATMTDHLAAQGFEVVSFATFEEENDNQVARICESSVLEGMKKVGAGGCDLVFASCTNLRSFSVIEAAEEALGIPVISSNSALAWHMLRLSGVRGDMAGPGRVFSV